MGKDLHRGHRQRLKSRFLKDGNFDNFEPHNIIELLLFYAVPQKDTNEMAHELLNKFKSISGILHADYEQLTQVKGISEHSALLIKMIAPFCSVYYNEGSEHKIVLDNSQKLCDYFVNKYIGINVEQVYVLCMDNNCAVLDGGFLFKGSVCSSNIDTRTLVDFVLKSKATSVAIAHNHPNADAKISNNDVIATTYIKNALKLIDVTLVEHVVISDRNCVMFTESGYL